MALLLIDTHEFAIFNDKSEIINDKCLIADFEFRIANLGMWEGMEHGEIQRAVSSWQRSEDRNSTVGAAFQPRFSSFNDLPFPTNYWLLTTGFY